MLPFPEKISYFHPPKFLTTFSFSHRPQILNFPPVLLHFPPDSRKFIMPPTFQNFPPCFRKIQQLFTYFTFNFPPTLTMMHLCITQCTYWTPLAVVPEAERMQQKYRFKFLPWPGFEPRTL